MFQCGGFDALVEQGKCRVRAPEVVAEPGTSAESRGRARGVRSVTLCVPAGVYVAKIALDFRNFAGSRRKSSTRCPSDTFRTDFAEPESKTPRTGVGYSRSREVIP